MRERWSQVALVLVVGCFLAGAFTAVMSAWYPWINSWVALFYLLPALYGAIGATALLREDLALRSYLKRHPRLPDSGMIDVESGVGTFETVGGELVSIEIPAEVIEQGPEAVVAYVLDELE